VKYRNPDIPSDHRGIADALRASKLPKRAPTDDDSPRHAGAKHHAIEGQLSVFDVLDADQDERR